MVCHSTTATSSQPQHVKYIYSHDLLSRILDGDSNSSSYTIITCKFRYNTHTGKHNELVGLDMKRSMEDLFYKYHVNVAFSGHVHAYERFLPIYKNVTTMNATIYMTVGTGGQSYGMLLLPYSLLLVTSLLFPSLSP